MIEQKKDDGVGVPEALPRTLKSVGRRLGAEVIDRLWIFPPLVKGRKEWGLVAASCFDDQGTRRVITARYSAERTGKGLFLDAQMAEEGSAPHDRLPRVMDGVVARSALPTGSPRVVDLSGGLDAWDALLEEYDAALFEEAVVGPPQAN
jgi:hypothetical protein